MRATGAAYPGQHLAADLGRALPLAGVHHDRSKAGEADVARFLQPLRAAVAVRGRVGVDRRRVLGRVLERRSEAEVGVGRGGGRFSSARGTAPSRTSATPASPCPSLVRTCPSRASARARSSGRSTCLEISSRSSNAALSLPVACRCAATVRRSAAASATRPRAANASAALVRAAAARSAAPDSSQTVASRRSASASPLLSPATRRASATSSQTRAASTSSPLSSAHRPRRSSAMSRPASSWPAGQTSSARRARARGVAVGVDGTEPLGGREQLRARALGLARSQPVLGDQLRRPSARSRLSATCR